ncbi:hypothetical protein [Terasakiella sp.]|uniref:hypothetical protein n=1 Tax=Terasakiella sp. TaxID=2034861 RepID=UPI003B00A42C
MFEFLNDFADFFSVGDGYTPNSPATSPDAINTDNALSSLGYFGQNGESEFALPSRVKAFQDTNGLKPDGVINAGGPTEKAISDALKQRTQSSPPSPKNSADSLPSHVTVKQTGDQSFQASASFAEKPKITPETGLVDASEKTPKLPKISKAQTDKMWAQVAENQKAQTTQNALQNLLNHPLYQKKDKAYLKHVQGEFKRAYPGEVQYDTSGQMRPIKPVIKPQEVRAFNQPKAVDANKWEENNPERTWDPQSEQRDREEYRRKNPEPPVPNLSFQEMQNLLEQDADAFNRLPQADRAAYHAYMKKIHINRRPDQKPHDRAEVTRNAIVAGREGGAGSYVGEAVTQPFLEAGAQVGVGLDLLMGNEPDYEAFEKRMKEIRDRIPAGYQGAEGIRSTQKIGKGLVKAGSFTAAGPCCLPSICGRNGKPACQGRGVIKRTTHWRRPYRADQYVW